MNSFVTTAFRLQSAVAIAAAFLVAAPETSYADEVVTNIWTGAAGFSGNADEVAYWSLGHLPTSDEAARFCYTVYNVTVSNDSAIAAKEIYADGGYQCTGTLNIGKSMEVERFGFSSEGNNGQGWQKRVCFGPDIEFKVTGNGTVFDHFGNYGVWGAIHVRSNSTINIAGSDVCFTSRTGRIAGKSVEHYSLHAAGNLENSDYTASSKFRFSAPGGTVRLYGGDLNDCALSLGNARLQVRSDQVWKCAPDAIAKFAYVLGAKNVTPPSHPYILDEAERLDNFGEVNIMIAVNGSGDHSESETGMRFTPGTYGSISLAGGTTSRRDRYVYQTGYTRIKGACAASDNRYGMRIETYNSQAAFWGWIVGAGNTLTVDKGICLNVGPSGGSCRLGFSGATLNVGGDIVIESVTLSATNAFAYAVSGNSKYSHLEYSRYKTGIYGNGSSVLNLAGSFSSNIKAMSQNIGNLALSTVNLGGGDGIKTFEVCDKGGGVDVSGGKWDVDKVRNTWAVSNLCVGTSEKIADIRLVNEYLNNNPTNLATTAGDNSTARFGEQLTVCDLSVGPGSKLRLNGQNVVVARKLFIDAEGTLDCECKLPAGESELFALGTPGDRTAEWSAFAHRVVNSKDKMSFKAFYDADLDITCFRGRKTGLVLIIR